MQSQRTAESKNRVVKGVKKIVMLSRITLLPSGICQLLQIEEFQRRKQMPEEKRGEERVTMAKPCTEWRRLK